MTGFDRVSGFLGRARYRRRRQALLFLVACFVMLRGLSVLRFAVHSPLPDGSHMEEACIRSFGGETSGDGLPRAAASPSGSEGPGSALGPVPFFHLKPLAEIPHCRRAARDCPRKLSRWFGGDSCPTADSLYGRFGVCQGGM